MRILRRLAVTAGTVLVLVGTVLLGLRWVEGPATTAYAAVQTLAPVGGVLAAAGGLLLAVSRAWRLSLLSLVPVVAAGALAWPTVHPSRTAPGPSDLVVLSSNLEYGGATTSSLVAEVSRLRPDVVILVEVTPEALARLDATAVGRGYPYRAGGPAPVASGLVLLSRHRLDVLPVAGADHPVAFARVHSPGGDVLVRGVHPSAPTSPDLWRAGLDSLADWVGAVGRGEPLVVAGDYNATWSHPGFRRVVVAGGLADTSRVAGHGWAPTWPMGRRLPPFAQIDHVLVRGAGVVDAGTADLEQTDHRAVWARLRLPGR